MRVCIEKVTGKLLESQVGDDPKLLQTLIDNAVNAGFKAIDVQAYIASDVQYKTLLDAVAPPIADPIDQWDMVSLKIAFNHENRIRTLEGKPAITIVQFKTAVKAIIG